MTILVITAVEAERDAAVGELPESKPIDIGGYGGISVPTSAGELWAFHAGVGPVAAAATTAVLLALGPEYELVVSAGIAGGFRDRAEVGDVVWADQVIAADQGVVTDDGFLTPARTRPARQWRVRDRRPRVPNPVVDGIFSVARR